MNSFLWFCYITLALIGVVAIADLFFFMKGGIQATLSYQFWKFSKQWPLIPFVFGFLCGHLVWQYDPDCAAPATADLSGYYPAVYMKLHDTDQIGLKFESHFAPDMDAAVGTALIHLGQKMGGSP